MELEIIETHDLLKDLDDQQIKAVTASFDRPTIVLAGPGSGKTRVIVHRIAHMIQEGIDPFEIVAVTFSNKAAEEIRIRVRALTPASVPENICTIHAFFKRLLRDWELPNAKINDWKVRDAIQAATATLNWDVGYRYVRWWIDRAKMNGCSTAHQAGEFFGDDAGLIKHQLVGKLEFCFDEVQKAIALEGKITFADMVSNVAARVFSPKLRGKYLPLVRSQYKYVLIDEGQDTFAIAVNILKTIFRDRYFIVGDPDQTLYRFTGADPELNLFASKGADVLTITNNYRSVPDIVSTANKLIAYNYTGVNDRKEFAKTLTPVRLQVRGGKAVTLIRASPDEKLEAQHVADEVDRLLDSTYCKPGGIFVSARTNAQLVTVERELTLRGVPNVILGSAGFFSQKHIRQVMNYLWLAVDHDDDDAFVDVYNIASAAFKKPHRWLGQKFIEICEASGGSLWSGMVHATDWRYKAGVTDLVAFTNMIPTQKPAQAISYIVNECYQSYYTRSIGNVGADPSDDDNVLTDLSSLLQIAKEYDEVAAFLIHVKSMQAAESASIDFDSSVVLSTVHKLKGLERKVMFVIGVSEGMLPHYKSFTPDASEFPLPNSCTIKDERNILFVAMTRAADKLYISHLQSWNGRQLTPSRFLFEAGLLKRGKDAAQNENQSRL